MKKQYSKPGIIIEDFRLSEHIASCAGVNHENSHGSPQHWSKDTCAWLDVYGSYLFVDGMQACTKPVDPNGDAGGFCYNNPENGYSIFGS